MTDPAYRQTIKEIHDNLQERKKESDIAKKRAELRADRAARERDKMEELARTGEEGDCDFAAWTTNSKIFNEERWRR